MSSATTQRHGWLAVCAVAGLLAVPAAVADYIRTLHGIDRTSEELLAWHGYELRAWIYLAVLTAGLITSAPLLTATASPTARKDRLRQWYGRATGVAALIAAGLSYATYVVHHRDHRPLPVLQIWMAVGVLLGVTLYLWRESPEPATRVLVAGHDEPRSPTNAPVPALQDDRELPAEPPALDLTDRQALITSVTLCVATLVLAVIAMPAGCGSATPANDLLFFAGIVLGLFGVWCLCTSHWTAGLLPIALAAPTMYLSTLGGVCDTLRVVSS